jgi:hypothetical protein
MRRLRFCVLSLSVIGIPVVCAAPALASPEWWVRETGAATSIPLAGTEVLNEEGYLTIEQPTNKPFKCSVKGYEKIENVSFLGYGELQSFEGICEKGSPYPCTFAEPSEFHLLTAPTSKLVTIGTKAYDEFPTTPSTVEIEFYCLKFNAHAVYKAITPVKPQVGINKLKFAGKSSGEFEITPFVAVPILSIKGSYYAAPSSNKLKVVRWK